MLERNFGDDDDDPAGAVLGNTEMPREGKRGNTYFHGPWGLWRNHRLPREVRKVVAVNRRPDTKM